MPKTRKTKEKKQDTVLETFIYETKRDDGLCLRNCYECHKNKLEFSQAEKCYICHSKGENVYNCKHLIKSLIDDTAFSTYKLKHSKTDINSVYSNCDPHKYLYPKKDVLEAHGIVVSCDCIDILQAIKFYRVCNWCYYDVKSFMNK